jgi:hypothetical protein
MTEKNHLLYDRAARRAPVPAAGPGDWRIAALERQSIQVTRRAAAARVPIKYLGIAQLFSEPTAYTGPQTDWLIAPAGGAVDSVVPRAVRHQLLALDAAGLRFPLVYIAHEVPKGQVPVPAAAAEGRTAPVTLDRKTADAAVGPVPPAAASVAVADRLGRSSQTLLSLLGKVVPIAAAALAAPFVVTGVALSALAGLDPIVFGVIPAASPVAGRPAAWYLLAQWDWE